jgi:hypothetical protein
VSKRSLDSDQIQQLEATIFAARNFVVPTEDLRPRTLSLAKETSLIQQIANRSAITVTSIMLVWLLAVPVLRSMALYRDSLRGPMSAEIEHAAQVLTLEHRYEPGWGLVDAFQDSRKLELEDYSRNGDRR